LTFLFLENSTKRYLCTPKYEDSAIEIFSLDILNICRITTHEEMIFTLMGEVVRRCSRKSIHILKALKSYSCA